MKVMDLMVYTFTKHFETLFEHWVMIKNDPHSVVKH